MSEANEKMEIVQYSKYKFNVKYYSKFLNCDFADQLFEELKNLQFKTSAMEYKTNLPHYYGFGERTFRDESCEVVGVPWTDSMLELKDLVEKTLECTYNFALVKYYESGFRNMKLYSPKSRNEDIPAPIISLGAEVGIGIWKLKEACNSLHPNNLPYAGSISITPKHGSMHSVEILTTHPKFCYGFYSYEKEGKPTITITFLKIGRSGKKRRIINNSDDTLSNSGNAHQQHTDNSNHPTTDDVEG